MTMVATNQEELALIWAKLGSQIDPRLNQNMHACVALIMPNDVVHGSFLSADDYGLYGSLSGLVVGTDLMSRAMFPEREKQCS